MFHPDNSIRTPAKPDDFCGTLFKCTVIRTGGKWGRDYVHIFGYLHTSLCVPAAFYIADHPDGNSRYASVRITRSCLYISLLVRKTQNMLKICIHLNETLTCFDNKIKGFLLQAARSVEVIQLCVQRRASANTLP